MVRRLMRGMTMILCLGHAATSAATPPERSVPFELFNGHIYVMAEVDGQGPYRFGFDTGASGNGRVDARLTSQLALPHVGKGDAFDGISTASADLVSIKSLRLGPIEKHNLQMLSRDYSGGRNDAHSIQGIIARDFFSDWIVTIDYPRRTITFGRTHLRTGGAGVVAYEPSFAIPVCFKQGCFTGKIDTGSSRGIVVPKALAQTLPTSTPVKIGEANRTNGTVTLFEMTLREPVQISGVSATDQKLLFSDPSGESINVGSDFLKDYVLTIDQSRRLLSVRKP